MPSVNDLLIAPVKPLLYPRNMFWDTLFYDVTNLSQAAIRQLADTEDLEGTVVVVSPNGSGKAIRSYPNATAMLKVERENIGGVAIAGVGSSNVGTAALAMNVADAYQVDVAGVVSGYGIADVLTDAIGGQLFYRYLDRWRHQLEIIIERSAQTVLLQARNKGAAEKRLAERDQTLPRELESGTLLDILSARPANLKILVGHSKGALLIDYVLEKLVQRMAGKSHPYYDDLHVVTVSALVALPKEFTKTSQIIGKFDWFGGINSLPDLLWDRDAATRPTYIENAWHHLNNKIPFSLNLVEALGKHVQLAPRRA